MTVSQFDVVQGTKIPEKAMNKQQSDIFRRNVTLKQQGSHRPQTPPYVLPPVQLL